MSAPLPHKMLIMQTVTAAPAKAVAKKRPQNFIFRTIKSPGTKLAAEQVRLGVQPRLYLAPTNTILWPYRTVNGKNVPCPLTDDPIKVAEEAETGVVRYLPRSIRYVQGLNTPFADEQDSQQGDVLKRENGMNNVLDNPANRDAILIVGKELRVPAEDSVRIEYLRLSGQCLNQHPLAKRYGATMPEYQMVDFGQMDMDRIERGKLKEKCYKLASTAREAEMIPHASYMNIPFKVQETGEDRDIDAIREDYKDMALTNPELFDKTYADPKIKLIHAVKKLQESGHLAINNIVAGQAHWSATGKLITNLPPDEDPISFLAEFALTKDGTEFANHIRASEITK